LKWNYLSIRNRFCDIKDMLCQICKESTATIHLTEILQGQRNETHLCQRCAQQQGLGAQTQVPLNELLSNLLAAAKAASDTSGKPSSFADVNKACPVCGMTLQRFSDTSLLGCPQDYEHFQQELMPLIERTHSGRSQHCGKVPSHAGQQQKNDVAMLNFRRQLEQAVKKEDYEAAAKLRDQIRQLQ
jgi:protein arginine kinase activator